MNTILRQCMLVISTSLSLFAFSSEDPEIKLLDALEANDIQTVNTLINTSMNLDFEINGSPLLIAIKNKNIELVELILSAGADPDYYGHYFYSPLHMALLLKNNDIIKALIKYNVNLEARESGAIGKTAILFTAQNGDIELMTMLIDAGANLNVLDNYGDQALAFAAYHGQLDMVKYLVGLSVDIQHQNNRGKTAKDHGFDRGHDEVVEYLENI